MIHLRLTRAFRMGVKSLLLHPMRSILTALSMVCGVGAVIGMLAIGEGASRKAQEQFRALGSNTIMIESVKPPPKEESTSRSFVATYGLTFADLDRIRSTIPDVELSVPVRDVRKDVWYKSRRYAGGRVVGTVYWFADVQNYELDRGRWISQLDGEPGHLNKVCALGAEVASRLFPLEDPIGKYVLVGNYSFKVVGVMANQAGAEQRTKMNLADLSKNVYIPLAALRTYFGELDITRTSGNQTAEQVELRQIIVRVEDLERVVPRATALETLLKRFHPEQDYRVVVPLRAIRQAEASARNFTVLLASIAAVSLFVGGIGIMNIMLATVTERTREIGIRRALGARKVHIIMQFLVETIVLTMFGGLIGVVLGVASKWIVPQIFEGQEAVVKANQVLLSFVISAAVGIIFGLYPAWRAANMDPIEALRHE